LIFTCSAFFLFAVAEVIGALASNSLSLLGDAGAMYVDVFTVWNAAI
jgi:Co/Zn/Cd efflux system component